VKKEKLLLHCCCAPCSTIPFQRLNEKYSVTLLFFNPNIFPAAEYQKRAQEIKNYASLKGIPYLEKMEEYQDWQHYISGLENEKEGGKRCALCYKYRLQKTARTAADNKFNWFATTLSVSPHKNAEMINKLGGEIGSELSLNFFLADFKKMNGFKLSALESAKEGFYRQNYCGCEYSIRS
jgi:epoxyqueuosine reductase